MKRIIRQLLKRILYGKPLTQNYTYGNIKPRNVSIDTMFPELVTIGDNFISAPGSRIIAHDASLFVKYNSYKVGRVIIGNDVFLGANAVVLAGVTIGNNVIIGSGAIVTKDIPNNSIAVGNPARVVSSPDEYFNKCKSKDQLVQAPECFEKIKKGFSLSHQDIYTFREIVNEKFSN